MTTPRIYVLAGSQVQLEEMNLSHKLTQSALLPLQSVLISRRISEFCSEPRLEPPPPPPSTSHWPTSSDGGREIYCSGHYIPYGGEIYDTPPSPFALLAGQITHSTTTTKLYLAELNAVIRELQSAILSASRFRDYSFSHFIAPTTTTTTTCLFFFPSGRVVVPHFRPPSFTTT